MKTEVVVVVADEAIVAAEVVAVENVAAAVEIAADVAAVEVGRFLGSE